DDGFYDFKAGKGGKIIKAVMELENKSWKDALLFLKDFSKVETTAEVNAERAKRERKILNRENKMSITKVVKPNNPKLIEYFGQRGISADVLKENTQQIHYNVGGKEYFGIGLKNQEGGYEIRNPYMKTKLGRSDISIINEGKNNLVVFEGMTDMLSFMQLLKKNNRENKYTLAVLNSVTNTNNFIDKFRDYQGKINLVLDGNNAGNEATQKIMDAFKHLTVEDSRHRYSIREGGVEDLNDYLKATLNIAVPQEKNRILAQENNPQNHTQNEQSIESAGVSASEPMGQKSVGRNTGNISEKSQSEQDNDNGSRQNVGSNDARNGLDTSEQFGVGGRGQSGIRPDSSSQQEGSGTQQVVQGEKYERGGQDITDGNEPRNQGNGEGKITDSFGTSVLDFSSLKGQKLSNEQITEIVNAVAFVSNTKEIGIKEGVALSDDIKNLVSQYKSGGVAKEGRGILDEYYTDEKLVNAVRNLIQNNFKGKQSIHVLEPSVGTGNFLYAAKDLDLKTNITAFEINETTAKIAKILHPESKVNLRSFETEFITDNGQKKEFEQKYDLVIGNPPYGTHRGLYKGLGEEPGIGKYENYFVKRSLDVMKEGGTLAMVLPSGWLNGQKKLNAAELTDAYRLPSGAFKATGIGTDIIILKKNSQIRNNDISTFFDKNPEKILGETVQRTNRFGRLENYIKGNLDDALMLLEEHRRRSAVVSKPISVQLNLFDTVEEDVAEKKITKDETQIEIRQELELAKQKASEALEALSNIKFKSLSVAEEIQAYGELVTQLETEPERFTSEALADIVKKADNIIQLQTPKIKKNRLSEYLVQEKPDIKKGILKYQFSKQDTVVDASIHNNNSISQDKIETFRDADYDGTIPLKDSNKDVANYSNGKWIHDFYYAEGNIYKKLDQLEVDFKDREQNGTVGQYEKQKSLLESVLPKPKVLDDIIISPNHEFVSNFIVGKTQRAEYGNNPKTGRYEALEMKTVDYTLSEKFKDFLRELPSSAFSDSYCSEVMDFINNVTVTGSDSERNALVRERRKIVANDLFNKYLREELTPELQQRFVSQFNRNYNNIHVPDYSQFPLFSKINQNFKGKPLNLTEVQKAGIGRMTTKGVGLLAHEVGFGKTLSGVLSMHEAMERGNAKRPLIVVPNDSILKQWVETIYETIPNAKVNVLGNLGKDYDLSKFDNKDNEITLVTYEGFNNIGFSQKITQELAERFSYISHNEMKSINNTERDIQKEMEETKVVEGKMKRGKVYDWEDFGFDHLTFDEVHNANHIVGKVRIEDRRFASDFRSQNQITSRLGMNTWVASQYIQDQNNGRNVTLLSATPFTNKPLEYYSVLSLVANKRLEESGYFNVNNFFETFMEADNDMDIGATGDIKFKSNVRRFKNNALFQQLLSEFIDIKGEEDNPELKRPNRINKEYKIKQNDLTRKQYDLLSGNYDESQGGAILTHILNARLIAFSPYLSKFYKGEPPTAKEFIENSPKLKTTIELIAQNKKDQPEAGQIIYSEVAVSEFPKIKEYLVNEVGFKDSEVGIITGKTTKNQRVDLQEKFNQGRIKVIIGSEAIQEGMNLQEKTSDMYLLSLPYNFTSLRQTEGRAWRQGNQWENIRVNYMLINDSIDVFMLQKLQVKQARYLEAMKSGANIIDISDVDTQELKTAIITDPKMRANIEITLEKRKLEAEKSRYAADLGFVSRKFDEYVKSKEYTAVNFIQNRIETYKKYAVDEKDGYWNNEIARLEIRLDSELKNLKKIELELEAKGVIIADFKKQNERTESKIAELDKRIKIELPEKEDRLITQYKQENEAQKNTVQVDFIAERAEENKTFFKLAPQNEKVAEKENIAQEEKISRFKR
ncbi:MAG: helicase-related protein, partial [Capnocytophaga sp.]|nr:helicase-related protein [Capnocytophaga sp.]